MPHILLPNTYVEHFPGPIVYLAGPIKSAPKWQWDAAQYFPNDVTLIIPRRTVPDALRNSVLVGEQDLFNRQRAWERYYMALAASKEHKGALLFWLPGEEEHHCEKAYGANTRLELGEWMTRFEIDSGLHIVFGSDRGFSDIEVIEYDLKMHAPGATLYPTLHITCGATNVFL